MADKTVLITGASQGIGAELARHLAKEGWNIAINCRSEAEAENGGYKVKEDCIALGGEAECFMADVSSHEACEKMVKAVAERFGTIDGLVNNAGITRDGLMVRMSEADYDLVIAVNQKSVFNMMKYVGAHMMRKRKGRIVNVASVAGLYGNPGQVNYSASKGAVIAMTKTVAKELGSRGVTVNAIAPGFIRTPMTDALTEDQKKAVLGQIALGRYGEVSEIAPVVAFLLSDSAAYITAQTIEISGGLTM